MLSAGLSSWLDPEIHKTDMLQDFGKLGSRGTGSSRLAAWWSQQAKGPSWAILIGAMHTMLFPLLSSACSSLLPMNTRSMKTVKTCTALMPFSHWGLIHSVGHLCLFFSSLFVQIHKTSWLYHHLFGVHWFYSANGQFYYFFSAFKTICYTMFPEHHVVHMWTTL